METLTIQSLGSPRALAQDAVVLIARRLATDLAAGSEASARIGEGMEYAGSRPYQPGDTPRRMDWRSTARRNAPFTREYESLHRVPFFLVVDNSMSMRASSIPVSKLDAAHWIAAAIGLIALSNMSPVAALGLSERDAHHRPAVREGDLLASLRAIDDAPPQDTIGLAEVMLRVMARAKATSLVVVISDFHDHDAIPALCRASARHDVIAVHLTDPAERSTDRFGFVNATEAETGRALLTTPRTRSPVAVKARSEFIETGCDHVAITTNAPFVRVLRHAFSMHARATGGRR